MSGSPHKSKSKAWHEIDIAQVLEQLYVNPSTGLTSQEAELRLSSVGFNHLMGQPPRSRWLLFTGQFKSILILTLIGAAAFAAVLGNIKDAGFIVSVVFINSIIGFYQEHRAEESFAALKKMLPLRVHVRRDGKNIHMEASKLVPGDLVILRAGDRVPADGRLIIAVNIDIDESTLTGESLPVSKQAEPLPSINLPLVNIKNMAYMNSMVTRGRAEMVVTATGMQTEMGQLSSLLETTVNLQSPLQVQLNQLGKRLGGIALVLVGLLFFLQLLRGVDLIQAIFNSIALAVAAIPEGLPVVVTVTLALGMHQMAKNHAVIKRLASVETLGCTSVICSDKTGTLTLNQMTVKRFFYLGLRFEVSGEGSGTSGQILPENQQIPLPNLFALLVPLVACNDSRINDAQVIGDPTEAALLTLAVKSGLNYPMILKTHPRIAEIPFDTAHKFMATFHQVNSQIQLFTKGAPDILLDKCGRFLSAQGIMPLDNQHREQVLYEYNKFASQGLRGLLVASRSLATNELDTSEDLSKWVTDLIFIGLVGLVDPPRPEAKQAIASCKMAGVSVKMITGDHQDTGIAIARELGLQGMAVTGIELDQMNANELADKIESITVFARVTPIHKVKIIQALQAKGHVVAMTGDGVNDAPALKAADIGVAMGVIGTEVAKAAASIVLTDDNFSTIVSAIRQGRTLYDNILKFIRFQLSTTVGAILTIFVAPILGLPEPFNPIQILWVAMIMDGPPAVSLALDAARSGIMNEPPRLRSDAILSWPRVSKIITFGAIMMIGTLLVLYYALKTGNEKNALTLSFTTFVLFQFFNIFNARFENCSSFSKNFFKNRMLWGSLTIVVALQILAVHWFPAQSIFGTTDLSLGQWATAIGVASSILILEEGRKAFVRWFS